MCVITFAGACALDEPEPQLGSSSAALDTPEITPPATAMERPERVYVLPVLWTPLGYWSQASSPEYAKAKQNLGIHLRMASEKYAYMLRNPVTGGFRGSFQIATWDDTDDVARMYSPLFNTLEPLRVYSSKTYESLGDGGPYGMEQDIVADVLDAAGCQAQSCPFVFVIMVAHPSDTAINGVAFNYGFNGGGGFLRMPMDIAARSHLTSTGDLAQTLQSVLLHELGHSFGLAHIADVYQPSGVTHLPPPSCATDVPAPWGVNPGSPDPYDSTAMCSTQQVQDYCYPMGWARSHFEFHCSASVMSYSKLNGTSGCLAYDAAGLCAWPDPPSIIDVAIPGELIAENVHNLALNELVFPELAKDFDLLADDDDGTNSVLWHTGNGAPDLPAFEIPGHPQLRVSSPQTDFGSMARSSFGYHTKPIEPSSTTFHGWRNWHSSLVGAGGWAYLDFDFPEDVTLGRVRVYTGYNNGTHRATDVEVHKGTTSSLVSCGTASLDGRFDGQTNVMSWGTCAGGKPRYRIRLKATTSGYVVVRGIRFFDQLGHELQAPRMPIASSDYTHTGYPSSPQNVVGWDQYINAYYHAFDADQMWHSRYVGANNWVSIDVRLPNLTTLSSLSFYTGHTNQYHPATRVQIEARNGDGDYVALKNVAVGPYTMVNLPAPTQATHLRLAFRAGPSGYVVVRGIRMFNGINELYTPIHEYEGKWPLL